MSYEHVVCPLCKGTAALCSRCRNTGRVLLLTLTPEEYSEYRKTYINSESYQDFLGMPEI